MTFKLGWKRDLPDHRDWKYEHMRLHMEMQNTLPYAVDLRPYCPPIWDQGQLGSCTAHGIAAALEFDRIKQKASHVFTPSRLFIYFNERAMEGTVGQDAGASIRDGIKSVATQGYCEEALWPYVISKFTDHPPANCYGEGYKFKAIAYYSIDNTNLQSMQTCLAAGFPIVFGCSVYESFMQVAQTGGTVIPMPGSDQLLGGHCMLCVGYNDQTQHFTVRNSWGTGVGDKGYFYMPFNYLGNSDLTNDCWTVRTVS